MDRELQDIIINLSNSSDLKASISNVSLYDRCRLVLINREDFLMHTLFRKLYDNNIKLINKEESEYILKHQDELGVQNLEFAPYIDLIDFSDIYDNIFRNAYVSVRRTEFLKYIKDPSDLIDPESSLPPNLPDETLEILIKNAKFKEQIFDLIDLIEDDKIKEKYLNMLKYRDRLGIICSFKSDEIKAKYLKGVLPNDRYEIICSFEDDNYKKKYFNSILTNKGEIIASFESDNDKINYLERYNLILTPSDKGELIASFKNIENINKCMKYIKNEKALTTFLTNFDIKRNREYYKKLCSLIKSESNLQEIFDTIKKKDIELGIEILSRINNKKILSDMLEFGMPNDISEYCKIISSKLDQSQIQKYINDSTEHINYYFLLNCKDTNLVIESLKHNNSINVKYNDDIKGLFEVVANNYNLNLDHLIKLAKISSCDILRLADNTSIQRAVNLDEEDFKKYLSIFDEKNYDLNKSSVTSITTIILHKEFRFRFPHLVNTFIDTLHLIDDGNYDKAKQKMEEVYRIIDKNVYNIDFNTLYNGLINKNPNITEMYNKMTYDFLTYHRNEYVNSNMDEALKSCCDYHYEDNELLKYVFKNINEDYIIDMLTSNPSANSVEENELINNEDLLKNLIRFKKNPSTMLTADMKKKISMFNKLCYKKFDRHINMFETIPGVKLNYEANQISKDYLVEIMANLNVDKLRDAIFTDEELFKELLEHLDKYDMLGWGSTFDDLASKTDLRLDADVVSAIINNYNIIRNIRNDREKENKTFNLASELDLADSLESGDNIYSTLLGEEDYRLIKSNPSPNSSSSNKNDRLKESIECLKQMHNKKYITVPSIDEDVSIGDGKTINIKVGNTNDPINLTYGERTGACMRIGGAGKSLFNFCLTDENGFHISFNDPETGEFVSRVSCFRNGNTLFLNQLRYSTSAKYTNKDIVKACKIIADRIIELTKDSKFPIENVIASNDYSLSNEKMTPLGNVKVQSGFKNKFYTDISDEAAVVISTSNNGQLVPIKTGPSAANRYPVGRAKVKMYKLEKANNYIKHIEALDMLYEGTDISDIYIQDRDIDYAYVGEDWYLAVTKDGEIISYIQKNSLDQLKAKEELSNYENLIKVQSYGGVSL